MPGQALAGLRVLDVSNAIPGIQLTQFLADYGADVIQVEPPGGSRLRQEPAYPFWARGRRSADLDLRNDVARAAALDLARQADVFVESFRPGGAAALGLGYDDLAALNPRLVYASISGFGSRGRFAQVPGYEGLVAAKLGLPTTFGPMAGRRGPAFAGVQYGAFAAAHTTLHGVLAALHERERSGHGQHVEGSVLQGLVSLDVWNWFTVLITERYPDAYLPSLPFDENGEPVSAFVYMLLIALTADGRWLQFAQVRPHLFVALLHELGLDRLFTDPYWEGIPVFDDQRRRTELWELLLTEARKRTYEQWVEVFDANPDVWAELFRSGTELLDHPQLQHDRTVVELADSVRGPVRQPGPMVAFDRTPAALTRSAPAVGDAGPTPAFAGTGEAEQATGVPAPQGLPLEGVTILELGVLFAAPYGATLLADLGARVIKVEPLEGDPIRGILPFPEAGGVKVMQGKDSIAVDMASAEGRALVQELAARADIVLQCFRPGVAQRLGIDHATLQALNPNLVYVSGQGYGMDGPCGPRAAFANTIGAAAGIARRNGSTSILEHADLTLEQVKAQIPRLMAATGGASVCADGIAALGTASALLLGLVARDRGAGAQLLRTSMLATNMHAVADDLLEYDGRPALGRADEDLLGLSARYRHYETADGWVFLAVPQESEWAPFVAAMPVEAGLAGDARFATEAGRIAADRELVSVLQTAFAARTAAEWEEFLLKQDVGCVAVEPREMEAVVMGAFGQDAGLLADVVHPTFDAHPRLAPVVRFSRSATQAQPGCLCGQHTDDILRELGRTPAQIAALRGAGVVG